MKAATGNYLNIFSDGDCNNHGLKQNLDLFIIFPEYKSREECDFNVVEEFVMNLISEYVKSDNYNVFKANEDIGTDLINILDVVKLAYDVQIIINIQ